MLRTLLLFVLFGTIFSFKIKQEKSNYCYATDQNSYKLFGSKTAYEYIHGEENENENLLRECKPVQFWSLNRHGTRLPDKKQIKKYRKLTDIQKQIIKNYDNEITNSKADGLCEQDIELFKNWSWNSSITKEVAEFLTVQGWADLRNMARRNLKKCPELLGIDYSEKDYLFRFTRTERTESSFKAYAEGLFGTYDDVHAVSVENDTLIKAYKFCKLWQETVDNPATYVEQDKFIASEIYQNLISDVSKRLGFKNTLDSELINNIYGICRFEQSWHPYKKSPWCAAFTKEHLLRLEYAEDLKYYYNTGHGTELNKKMGCMPLKDMMNRFENVINGVSTEPKSVHYFTHSSALQLFMVSMTMYKDKISPTAENWNEEQDRLWRTSLIVPFATNVNAVLYKCSNGDKNRVVFHINEKKYEFPGCPNGVCSWENVKDKFRGITENCNLDFCKNNE